MNKKKKHSGRTSTIRGLYYFSRKCKKCGLLICGESEDSEGKAQKDFNRRINAHHQEVCKGRSSLGEERERLGG